MAFQGFSSADEIKAARRNVSKIAIYGTKGLPVNSVLYTNQARTNRLGAFANIGVTQGAKLYKVSTNANGEITTAPQLIKERLLGWQPMFVESDQANKEYEIEQVIARGVNFFQFNISFDTIYKSKAEWDNNPDSVWAAYDRIYNFIKNRFPNFGVRINCITDDTNFYVDRNFNWHGSVNDSIFRYAPTVKTGEDGTPPPAFYADSDMVMDQFGMPIRAKSGWGRPTMFKQSARSIMVAFVQRVIQRYPLVFNKALWVSVPTTSDHEMGLEYIQTWNGSGFSTGSHAEGHYCMVDYHPLSQNHFKNVFMVQKYGTIQAVNDAWGKNYANFNAIEIPMVAGVSNISQTSFASYFALADSQAFVDWILHNVAGLKVFWTECLAVIAQYAPGVDLCFEVGSATDKLAVLRGTQNLLEIKELCNVFKSTQYETYSWGGTTPSVSVAIGRANWSGEIYCEVNSNDVPTQSNINDTIEVKNAMISAAKQGYMNDVKCIIFICTNTVNNNIKTNGVSGTNQFQKTLEAIEEIKSWLDTGVSFEGVTVTNTISQNLSDRYRKYDLMQNNWLASGGVNCEIVLVDNI
jgi:hypothetical protein